MRRMLRWGLVVGGVDEFHIRGPVRAVAASADEGVEFWTEEDEARAAELWAFRVVGTGHPVPDGFAWLGTAPRTAGGFVWHLYGRRLEGPEVDDSGHDERIVVHLDFGGVNVDELVAAIRAAIRRHGGGGDAQAALR